MRGCCGEIAAFKRYTPKFGGRTSGWLLLQLGRYAKSLENSLVLAHDPAVADACVVGHADAEAGEVPKAFIVAKGSVSEDSLIDFVASRVAPYKRIRAVEFIDALPRSPTGKLSRRVLVERDRAQRRR